MSEKKIAAPKKPEWLKTDLPSGSVYFNIKKDLRSRSLSTVCEEAKCPNIAECWSTNTATFMLLGDTCTRACRFCHIKTASFPPHPDPDEPMNVAESCRGMALKYVVMTMVNRDDLADGGANHIAKVVAKVKELNPDIIIELLMGDFRGDEKAIECILASGVHVYAHNLETVESLSLRVRDRRATYRQSLQVLRRAKQLSTYPVYTKSALMLGLGETYDEVKKTLEDLREHDVDIVTLGQYMRPTKQHLSVKEWVHPNVFLQLAQDAKDLGFLAVASAPLVRSSYRAGAIYDEVSKYQKKGLPVDGPTCSDA